MLKAPQVVKARTPAGQSLPYPLIFSFFDFFGSIRALEKEILSMHKYLVHISCYFLS
eukprot:m.26308 g.26308  ORF g.26308 m.26308 type:complete len:57 (-) comp38413_c0_seq1:16-186(-)